MDIDIKQAITRNGWELAKLPQEERTYEICLMAVKRAPHRSGSNESILRQVPQQHLSYELCMAAVQQDGDALRDVPSEFRNRELCLTAVKQSYNALPDVPRVLRDMEICEAAVEEYGMALLHIPPQFMTEELIIKALHTAPQVIQFVPEEYCTLNVCRYAARNDWSRPIVRQFIPENIWKLLYCRLSLALLPWLLSVWPCINSRRENSQMKWTGGAKLLSRSCPSSPAPFGRASTTRMMWWQSWRPTKKSALRRFRVR